MGARVASLRSPILRSSSFSVEQTFWRESDKSQGFGDGVPEAGAGMPLGTVPLSDSSTGSGVSPTILPIDSATEPLGLLSRICGAILVPGVVPSCDKGQFP